jgi:predicted ATP-binding protein involved in virulence
MDEPDLSMHIDWKEILISELHELNPNMQIILSTHAPSVIMQWRDRVKEVGQLTKSA